MFCDKFQRELALANVVIFSGGSGAAELIRGMLSHSQVDLSVVINGYDNGKSTGRIRAFVDGMLGPSDFRKTVAVCLNSSGDISDRAVGDLLEERIGTRDYIDALADINSDICMNRFRDVSFSVTKFFIESLNRFLDYEKVQEDFNFKDCAIGNIVFAGVFLGPAENQFSEAVQIFARGLNCPAKVYNVTAGENLFLNARSADGKYVLDEGLLVENPNCKKFESVFFSDTPLNDERQANIAFEADFRPKINDTVKQCISKADLIVYSPGTQFSSLIPSYMTKGLVEVIAGSKASKYLLVNLDKDKDMIGYTSTEIIKKILFYLTPSDKLIGTVNKIMIDPSVKDVDVSALPNDFGKLVHFETHSLDGTKHDRDVAVSSVMNQYFNSIGGMNKYFGFCSLIVPTLNEGERLSQTISSIVDNLDLLTKTRRLEVIVVDGACDPDVKKQVEFYGDSFRYICGSKQRGDSIRTGINAANGDLICLFPGDFEFEIFDLLDMIRYSEDGAYDVVLGSRSQNLSRLNKVNLERGFVSRFGGVIVTLFLYILHDFHVRDILTTIRVYKRSSLASLQLTQKGVDLDVEIPLRAFKAGMKVCEIPVSYNARNYSDGKKITLKDGLQVLFFTIFFGLLGGKK